MSEVLLTKSQEHAVRQACQWFRWFDAGLITRQIFGIYGYAGVGKTTIVKHVIGELGYPTKM